MKISILTLFPDMIQAFFDESIIRRAQEKDLVTIEVINLRTFATNAYGSVDDKPYGGGVGMVMRVDIIDRALNQFKIKNSKFKAKEKVILTSPRGKVFHQQMAEAYAHMKHLIIICGHYEGVDERATDLVHEEVSLGDFVMTGGEITAAAVVDAVVRLLPGVIQKDSSQEESFSEVPINVLKEVVGEDEYISGLLKQGKKSIRLLEYPHYTRPEEFMGQKVPDILLSGHHKEIAKWRLVKAYEETKKKRPDLLIA